MADEEEQPQVEETETETEPEEEVYGNMYNLWINVTNCDSVTMNIRQYGKPPGTTPPPGSGGGSGNP
jgi:hypothetical protein